MSPGQQRVKKNVSFVVNRSTGHFQSAGPFLAPFFVINKFPMHDVMVSKSACVAALSPTTLELAMRNISSIPAAMLDGHVRGQKSSAIVVFDTDRIPRGSHSPSRTSSLPQIKRSSSVMTIRHGAPRPRASPEPDLLLPRVRGNVIRSLPSLFPTEEPRVFLRPGPSRAQKDVKLGVSMLRRFHERGDLPASVQHRCLHNKLLWMVPFEALDYDFYLPIFFEGLRERRDPCAFLARRGILDMIAAGPHRILAVLPKVRSPL